MIKRVLLKKYWKFIFTKENIKKVSDFIKKNVSTEDLIIKLDKKIKSTTVNKNTKNGN